MRRITRSTSTRFINSSSAATVGEQWPKPCMPSFLDDLGILIRRHTIFCFLLRYPTVVSERSLIICMFRSRSYVWYEALIFLLLPCHVIFSMLDGKLRFCYKDLIFHRSLHAAFSMLVALIMVYIKLLVAK